MGSKNKEQVLLWFISAQHERHGSPSGRTIKIWPYPNRTISGVIDSTAVPLDSKILKQESWLPSIDPKSMLNFYNYMVMISSLSFSHTLLNGKSGHPKLEKQNLMSS